MVLEPKPAENEGSTFESLLETYQDMVFHLSYRLLGNRAAAEDLTQEVFLKVHKGWGGFRGESSAKTWIYRITLNAASNVRKRWARRSRSAHISLDDRPDPDGPARVERLEDEGADPERIAASSQLGVRLQAALDGLPEEFRDAVVLRDIEGCSYQEIASVLGVAVGTVKSRIGRGRSLLRKELADLV